MLGESIGTDSNDIHQYTIDKTTLFNCKPQNEIVFEGLGYGA